MKKGDLPELEIERYGMDGEGVARVPEGIVVFVPYVLVGERVKAQITFVKKNYAKARVVKVLDASDNRAKPACPDFFKCGGCTLMHIRQDLHEKIKRDNIVNDFKKIADTEVSIGSFNSFDRYGYRNKVQLPIAFQDGLVTAGYYKEKSHEVVPFKKCLLHGAWADKAITAFLEWANENKIRVYDQKDGDGILRHLVLRNVRGKVSVLVIINSRKLPKAAQLISKLKGTGINFDLHSSFNGTKSNVILGDGYETLYGDSVIKTELNGIKCSISPLSFMQVNDKVREKLFADVAERLKELKSSTVIDAYSGTGVLTNLAAGFADEVYGIELVKEAVSDADETARLNGNGDKIKNICGDTAEVLPDLIKKHRFATVILDPPRKGCDGAVMSALYEAEPQNIIYISCNPATLARDYAIIKDKYTIVSCDAYDMFPQTSHIETLLVLKLTQ